MPRISKKDPEEQKETVTSPEQQVLSYLNKNKEDHYNFEDDNYYKVPSSSLVLNCELNGGLPTGAHRFVGVTSGGKTSCALDFLYNFLKSGENRRGVYFKCEGRLSPDIQLRSGIKFTTNPLEWADNTCLIVETNIYETVFGLMRDQIISNPTKTKYFYILDSLDMMARKSDMTTALEDSDRVAGGALITSVFLKKSALALEKRGHIAVFISQVRDEIKINPYAGAGTPRQGKSSGGHAIEHGASVVLDFLPRWKDDVIRDGDPKNGKIVGHKCKIRIVKSDNEKYGVELTYPIAYGRTGGSSVWKELEMIDVLTMFEFVKRKSEKGAWFTIDEDLLAELREVDAEFPDKIQGLDNLGVLLKEKSKVMQFLNNKFAKTLFSN